MYLLIGILGAVSYVASQGGRIADCPAPSPPCICTDNGIIYCDNHAMTHLPPLNTSTYIFYELRITNNSLTTIGPATFASVNLTSIIMSNNMITTIDDAAFSGITNTLTTLKLNSNCLTSLPSAIGHLNRLRELDVSDNPIPGYRNIGHHQGVDGLTDSVIRQTGDTVVKFRFGSNTSLVTWPRSLRNLNRLQELTVSGSHVPYMPLDAFHGFECSLINLTIEYADLARVPFGIQRLYNLQELHLDHLYTSPLSLFGDDSMIHAPFDNIANSLKVLSLNYDGLTVFPEELNKLVNMRSLSMDGNALEFVSDEAIALLKYSNLTCLSMKNCTLKRVPGAISNLMNLQNLDVSYNLIRSIEYTDLQNLYQLRELTLSNNPLKYVSDNSLCGLKELRTLNLEHTSLTVISTSFRSLPHLMQLDFRDSKINCTCDLAWMKIWYESCMGLSKVKIYGQCETIDSEIQEYITGRLPTNCSEYSALVGANICGGTCLS